MKNFILSLLLIVFVPFLLDGQEIAVSIEAGPSPVPGKQRVTVKYNAVGGNFEGGNGTDEWSTQTITLGWAPGTGMTASAPNPNPNITDFTAPSGFGFVDNFTSSGSIVSFTLDQLGGASDGNVYTSFVVNGSTNNQPISIGTPVTVFFFDIPDTWSGGANSVFLLQTQPAGVGIGLAPNVSNSLLGNVWDMQPAGSPLPIELLAFSARPSNNTDARLDWSTASELNSARFEVERSTDAKNWQQAGTVAAAGNSNEKLDYAMTDRKVFDPAGDGTNVFYYRLKMVDLDGSFEYSPVRSVKFEGGRFAIGEPYPNPATRDAPFIQLPVFVQEDVSLKMVVYNAAGKAVGMFEREVGPGQQVLGFELGHLAGGVYHLKVMADRKVFAKRLVVH